jgi:hypothetical protein
MDFSTGSHFCDVSELRFLDLIFHPIAPAFDDHRFRVVQEPFQDGAGQGAVIVEDFGPVFIGLVGRMRLSEHV